MALMACHLITNSGKSGEATGYIVLAVNLLESICLQPTAEPISSALKSVFSTFSIFSYTTLFTLSFIISTVCTFSKIRDFTVKCWDNHPFYLTDHLGGVCDIPLYHNSI